MCLCRSIWFNFCSGVMLNLIARLIYFFRYKDINRMNFICFLRITLFLSFPFDLCYSYTFEYTRWFQTSCYLVTNIVLAQEVLESRQELYPYRVMRLHGGNGEKIAARGELVCIENGDDAFCRHSSPKDPDNHDNSCVLTDTWCPSPYVISENHTQCEAYCPNTSTWDVSTKSCIPIPEDASCKDQGPLPIDYIEGRKYRDEFVISAGRNFPFTLSYSYNNQANQEKTPIGERISVFGSSRFLADTTSPMSNSTYYSTYNRYGLHIDSDTYQESQNYGAVSQYWKHNFDEILIIQKSAYRYQNAKGQDIDFASLGVSASHTHL